MSIDIDDTIAAIASPAGAARRGIVRVSGVRVVEVVLSRFRADDEGADLAKVRLPTRFPGRFTADTIGVPIPAALMLWPTNRSYTGQPMAEIHTIGSPPLLDAILETLFACGARGANRGEFTMRSFLAGRIDLVQAEAVLGVIDATDHEELQTALTQLGGGATSRLAEVRSEILSLLGDLEAGLDFVEEDIEFITKQQIFDRLEMCASHVDELASDTQHRLPSGYRPRIVLAGLPNAGKSTLFNRLMGTGKAIVSPIAGTTRDYLIGEVNIDGMQFQIVDTAGWESTSDLIMNEAQNLRSDQMGTSDLVVWCTSATLQQAEAEVDSQLKRKAAEVSQVVSVVTQIDRIEGSPSADDSLQISVQADVGIDALLLEIKHCFQETRSSRSQLLTSTTARCRESLANASNAIKAAQSAAAVSAGDEVIAFELRDALRQIGIILGEVYTDDILDHIFSNFCIGK